MKKDELKNRGITLIALIITIIVMLILIAVTVSVALSGGLIGKAKEATSKTEEAQIQERDILTGRIKIGDTWYDSLDKYLAGEKSANQNDKPIEGTQATDSDIGKYVEYGVDLNGNGNYEDDWRIFYVDDQGHTFIIAADYVRGDEDGCYEVHQAIKNSMMTESTTNGSENFCFYWITKDVDTGDNQKVKYQCNDGHNNLNSSKNQCSYPNLFMATGYYCSDHVGDGTDGNQNSRCVSTLLCSDNWSSLIVDGYGASYAIGGPTLEMWVASWNKKHSDKIDTDGGITLVANGNDNGTGSGGSSTGYYVGTGVAPTTTQLDVTSCTSGYSDTLYFPHKSSSCDLDLDGTNEKCDGYWLSSPSAYNVYGVIGVWSDGRFFNYGVKGRFDSKSLSLRPLVCLNSNVQIAEDQNPQNSLYVAE